MGLDHTLFSSTDITPETASRFVESFKAGIQPKPGSGPAFNKRKAKFDEIRTQLGNNLNELSPDLMRLRADLSHDLDNLGLLPSWPETSSSAPGFVGSEARKLVHMFMGLSMGRQFRKLLPANLVELPRLVDPQVFYEEVFPFVVAVPAEPELRGLLAKSLMTDLVARTVTRHKIMFNLRKNFAWNAATQTGSAVYTFGDDLNHWPFGLMNAGVKFGKRPIEEESKEPSVVCVSCMEKNNPGIKASDIRDTVNFYYELRNVAGQVSPTLQLLESSARTQSRDYSALVPASVRLALERSELELKEPEETFEETFEEGADFEDTAAEEPEDFED
jgi:hypothetical protein